jgi:ATP-dependent DNA helicase RecQ
VQLDVTPETLSAVLHQKFGLQAFRRGQREIIESVLGGHDTMAVMPTGGGKSLCYQLPSVFREGIVVVISPLIALMEDQVRALKRMGLSAGYIHSGQTLEDKRALFAEMKGKANFILYLSPERVQKSGFSDWIKQQKISLFAVDESHCVSQWGPDFRKDYYRLTLLRQLRPDVPILALTATATPMVLKDIARQLQLREPAKHVYGFYRPNLYSQVETCENEGMKQAMVRRALIKTPTGRVLIYCGTRKQAEELTASLQRDFVGAAYYHAGLSPEDRTRIQKDYENGATRILAATNAFGMGIDHPDVRMVIHYQMPSNIESYYQEMGRAGRDGLDSTCLLLYSKRDKGLHSYFITQSDSDEDTTRRRWRALDTIVQFCDGGECRHAGILTYFRDTQRIKSCGHCDICAPDSARRVEVPLATVELSRPTKTKKSRNKGATTTVLSQEEMLRFEVLRNWRKDYADANDMPAFLVFSNKALEDLARKNPTNLAELENVYGFGEHKVEHFGALVLGKLAECESGT